MHLSSEEKKEVFATYGASNTDTGSPESQIALFSLRIAHLTAHLTQNDYLIKKDINRYRAIIAKKELGIRK